MTRKVSRVALIAGLAIGASGLVAVSAEAAPSVPTFLVNQPVVTGVARITPESATVSGAIDTGGNPLSSFALGTGAALTWDGNINLTGPATEYVDGIPYGTNSYAVSGGGNVTVPSVSNGGADNFSTVLFEYDPVKDYVANGNNPGPETAFAPEVDVNTTSGLSSVSATLGAYPAANSLTSGQSPLTPGTSYYYWIVQQAGETDAAFDVNTVSAKNNVASATGVNPSYTCLPYPVIAADYPGYSTTGTISGGLVAAGGAAQTTPQPQIQGPCVLIFGGGNNWYQSANGRFTTPKLGSVALGAKAVVSGRKGTVSIANRSVEPAKGTVTLTYKGKNVATGRFKLGANGKSMLSLSLTAAGVKLTKSKSVSAKVNLTTTTDQLSSSKSVTL